MNSKVGKRHRIKDARGRSVTQLDPVAMHFLYQHNVIDAEVLRAIVNEEGVRITKSERVPLLAGALGAVLVIGLFTIAMITSDIRGAPYAMSAGLIWLCAMPWIVWFVVKRRRFGKVAAAMLKHLRCPHCGYDLRMLPIDPADGTTICPECGCAWRLGNAPGAEGNSNA